MRMSDWSSDVCSSDLAYFAGLDRLLEVPQRDVAPDVAAQVDADGVDAPLHVADLGHAVVRLDLGGVGIEVQVQRLDEAPRERGPVHVRGGRDRSEEHTSELQSLMRNSYAVFCLT